MATYRAHYQSWIYNFVHHYGTSDIEAKNEQEAEQLAKKEMATFPERDNVVLKKVELILGYPELEVKSITINEGK